MEKNVPAFIRYSRGQDIAAACGQLALIENATSSASGSASGLLWDFRDLRSTGLEFLPSKPMTAIIRPVCAPSRR